MVIWIARDYMKCSGCRKCEITCSVSHENRIWPETSRIRVFMLVPGAEIPHLCAQCHDYPCVESCSLDALSVNEKTGAVIVHKKLCTGCGNCIKACPGVVPYMHPTEKSVLICDLCGGNPKCVKTCQENGYNCLSIVKKLEINSHKLYSKKPEETTKDLVGKLYGEKGMEFV